LEYIPKIILLWEFKNYINQLWDWLSSIYRLIQRFSNIVSAWNIIICPAIDCILMVQCRLQGIVAINNNRRLRFLKSRDKRFLCGPGKHLEKRLVRGDRGINPMDAACREYDIAYSRSKDFTKRSWQNIHWGDVETNYCEIRLLKRELLQQLFRRLSKRKLVWTWK